MKKYISILLVSIVLLSLASCGKDESGMFLNETVAAMFDDCISVKEALRDIRNIELFHEYDLSGLSPEKAINKDDGTTVITYYNSKNEPVYVFYDGFGEDGFDRFLKSASGRDLTVTYYDKEDSRAEINCDDYSIRFDGIDETKELGAENVYVCIKRQPQGILPETLECWYENGRCTSQYAFVIDEKGYHRYGDYVYDDGEAWTEDELLVEHIDEAPVTNSDMLVLDGVYVMPNFIVSNNMLAYTGSKDNPQWYLNTDFVMTFDTEEKAEEYRRKYSLEPSDPRGDEDENITQRTGEIFVPIAKDCEHFDWLVITGEINDAYYLAVSLNENGEISAVNYGIYSLY